MKGHVIKPVFQMISEKALQVKDDVEDIRDRLHMIHYQLNRSVVEKERIEDCLHDIQDDQKSFQERVSQLHQKIKEYKSYLAS